MEWYSDVLEVQTSNSPFPSPIPPSQPQLLLPNPNLVPFSLSLRISPSLHNSPYQRLTFCTAKCLLVS